MCTILCEFAKILGGYKQSHDSVQDESNLGDDRDADELKINLAEYNLKEHTNKNFHNKPLVNYSKQPES